MNGDRRPEDTKSKDNLSVKRNNFTHNKVAQRSGIAHNKDLSNTKTNDWALVMRRSPKNAKLNESLDVERNNRSGPKSRSYTTRSEQEAVDRRSENARVNVCDAAGSNKGNGPKLRSYIKRSGQRPPRGSVPEHATVIRCDRSAKIEDCLGAAHNNDPRNSSIEECAFVEDQSNKDAKPPATYPDCVEVNGSNCNVHTNRTEQDPSGVRATSVDQVKTKANQIVDGVRSPEDAKLNDYPGIKTIEGDK
jgi:hypothetical protein